MVTESSLNLKQIIDFLKDARSTDWEKREGEEVWVKSEFECRLVYQKVNLYEIEASQFLSFAKQDLEEGSERGWVNALSNARRAIACRVDEILKLLNLKSFASRERWDLRYKMEALKTFDVLTPGILTRLIARKRNLLEHEYIRPGQDESRDIVDVAELFLKATAPYIEEGYIASATVATTVWCKPGVAALTWFEQRRGKDTTAKWQYEDGYCFKYRLEPDLENATITLSNLLTHLYRRSCSERGETQEGAAEPILIDGPVTIATHDCKKEDIKELMILLRGRGHEGRR